MIKADKKRGTDFVPLIFEIIIGSSKFLNSSLKYRNLLVEASGFSGA